MRGCCAPNSVAAPAHDEAAQVIAELAAMPEAATGPAPVAMVFDYASAWAWDTQPQGRDFSYFRLMLEFYKGLRRLGLSVDMVPPAAADLSAYRLVLVPGMMSLTPELLGALARHKGVALLGPRTNSKTAEFAIPLPLPPNLPGLDATIARVESLPPDVERAAGAAAGRCAIGARSWKAAATVVERATDGWPALVAAGGLHYLGGWPDEIALDRILRRGLRRGGRGGGADARLAALPRQRGAAVLLQLRGGAACSHAGVTIPAAGVHWTRTLRPREIVQAKRSGKALCCHHSVTRSAHG